VYGEKADDEPQRREPLSADVSELPADLKRIVERVAKRERERGESRPWS
jgi:hypothetical protein